MPDTIRSKILDRIGGLRREIRSWEDVPSHDGPASASLALVYEQIEAEERLPVLREELAAWTEALAELDRVALRSPTDIPDVVLHQPSPEVRSVIQTVSQLTPGLIHHLRTHHNDINLLPWDVFEHLVGEYLKGNGFEDVRLVGRDPITAADLYAAYTIKPAGLPIRFFVEVKRNSRRVDTQVINSVHGAFIGERPVLGWHAALIVSSSGFVKSRRYSKQQLSCLGIELRDRTDLIAWLENYKSTEKGLWLPNPLRKMPSLATST